MSAILKNEYMYNKKFREYVDRYCEKHECSVKEALKKKKIKLAFWQYTDL